MERNVKQILPAMLMAVLVCFAASGQAQDKKSDGKSKVAEEIKQLDRQWIIEPYGSRDLKDFDRIVAEDFLITGSIKNCSKPAR